MKENSREKTARIYSSALYDAVAGSAQIDGVKKDAELLLNICKQDNSLIKQAASPLLSDDEQKSIWQQVAAKAKLSKDMLKFLDVLVENRRIGYLPAVLKDFIHLYFAGKNVAEVKVETVKELSATQDKKLCEVLKKKLDRDVVVEYVINPAILGGLRIYSGSKMYDGSLSHKLNCLENLMKGK